MRMILFFTLLVAVKIAFSQGDTMYVQGRHLYSAANEKIVLRGMNEMFVWSNDRTGQRTLPEIAKTGSNCVRLVWTEAYGNKQELAKLIDNCVANKMIAMPESHDATGDWDNLDVCINFWNDSVLIDAIQRNKRWSLINIGNEVGDGKVTDDMFRSGYMRAIDSIRKWGYTVPIVIDASNWGQSVDIVFNTWQDILAHDPLHNIIFSVHSYWTSTANYTRVADKSKNENMPIIIGEGPSITMVSGCKLLDYETGLTITGQNEIGWLSWSWGLVNNGDCPLYFDHTTNGKFGKWESEDVENLVVTHEYSLMNTAERPASMFDDGIVALSGVYVRVENPKLEQGDSSALQVFVAPVNAVDKSYELSIVQTEDILRFSEDSSYIIGQMEGTCSIQVVNKATGITHLVPISVSDTVVAIVEEPFTTNLDVLANTLVYIGPNPVADNPIVVRFSEYQSGEIVVFSSLGHLLSNFVFDHQMQLSLESTQYQGLSFIFVKVVLDDGTVLIQQLTL